MRRLGLIVFCSLESPRVGEVSRKASMADAATAVTAIVSPTVKVVKP
jgi:hypothetical protein